MQIEQKEWTSKAGWTQVISKEASTAQLVLVFGSKQEIIDHDPYTYLRSIYPASDIVICSTAGQIIQESVKDGTITSTAITMNNTDIRTAKVNIKDFKNSNLAGAALLEEFEDDLKYLLVISDGQLINGSELIKGLQQNTKLNIPITGGLAGDDSNFDSTLVGLNEPPKKGEVVGVGFYGDKLEVGHGSFGGWDPFGPERIITKSEGNILYELDGKSALDLYKKYLGEKANELPGSALLFPLSIKLSKNKGSIVRTVLSIDEESKSMTFAGDIPQNSLARLMKANYDKLIDGAQTAAEQCNLSNIKESPELALLISCVGRKLVLGDRADEEIEEVKNVLGDKTILTGFYSYGEISPLVESSRSCELHNQTMTITTLSEL